jgi:hypothetical protein
MKLEISGQVFVKCSNVEFNANSSSGRLAVPWGRTCRDRQTDMTRLTAAYRNFANVLKNK